MKGVTILNAFVKRASAFLSVVVLILSMTSLVSAHSGRTDSNGGHKDNKNKSGLGSYHYHCGGYPAHLHDGGYCPYTDVFPSYVSVTADNTSLKIGETANISASISPSNSCNTSISWQSSDTSIVSVSDGKITAKGYGTATITATTFNGIVGQAVITVKEIVAESVLINEPPAQMFVGDSVNLTASITPENVDNPRIEWSSSDNAVAEVSASEKLIAKTAGTVRITATASNGVAASFDLHVEEKVVESVSLDIDELSLFLGDTYQLCAEVAPADATDQELTWTSSESSIVTVDENGKLSTIACGTATVTATANNGVSDAVEVTVEEILIEDMRIIGPSEMQIGSNNTLDVEFTPSNATNQYYTWTSSDENILSIDEDGAITACSVGTATVTATHSTMTASCEIEVLPIPVDEIRINADVPETVEVGTTIAFSASVLPRTATYQDITWSVDDEDVGTIDDNGNFTALSGGKVVVTVRTEDGAEASCTLTVKPDRSPIVGTIVSLGAVGLGASIIRKKKRR